MPTVCQAFDQGHNLQLYPAQKYLDKGAGGTQIHLPNPLSLWGLLVETVLTRSKGDGFLDEPADVLIIDTHFSSPGASVFLTIKESFSGLHLLHVLLVRTPSPHSDSPQKDGY